MNIEMNCPHCKKNSSVIKKGDLYFCVNCGGAFKENGSKASLDEIKSAARSEFEFDGTVLTKYVGSETTVIIPDFITTIDEGAFKKCTEIKYITIPASVKEIKYSAFEDCKGLIGVYSPSFEAWSGIDFDFAFTNPLQYAANLYFGGEIVNEVTFPEGCTSIPRKIFDGYGLLETVNLPASLERIEHSAFANCKGLSDIVIPENVTFIDSCAFYGCHAMAEITMGKNVSKIEASAFTDCSRIREFYIPDGVTAIPEACFEGCTQLRSVRMSDNVTKIGVNAFLNCENLEEITLPENLEDIEPHAFEGCASLKSVDIPYGTATIDDNAFSGCASLTDLYLPCSVQTFGSEIFSGCTSLANVTLDDKFLTSNYEFLFEDCPYLETFKDLLSSKSQSGAKTSNAKAEASPDAVIPQGVTVIAASDFKYSKITSITIPSSVTKIEEYAFLGCKELKRVYIEDLASWFNIEFKSSPLEYANELYVNGELVTDLVIPDGVTVIPKNSLRCENITSVTIPARVKTITMAAFANCANLTKIEIPNTVADIHTASLFRDCRNLREVTLPNSIKKLDDLIFSNCKSLTGVNIPNVISIGTNAFQNCKSLTSIDIPSTVTYIAKSAFANCSNLSVIIPESVTFVGEDAFKGVATVYCKMKKPLFGLPKGFEKNWCGKDTKVVWNYKG